ncbi:nudix domain-containing [Trichoderma cornu-damae]|uniref:Nudix domain-containing n=1 Tax=Trichoderma cornu-damae TaxID=654480 RepID=A0A9P8TXM4_9HYPO|nr:nudix domain-containing [Trichoderma cornu-damae]
MNLVSCAVARLLSHRAGSLASSAHGLTIENLRPVHLGVAAMASTPPTHARLYSSPASLPKEKASGAAKKAVPEPRPSSSIVLLSPTNEVLLLHRVKTSTSFASAHVFPGGNLDAFHDGDIPAPDAQDRHLDGPAYRLGAIRECFEETGILLARKDGRFVELPRQERDEAREKIHESQIAFADWLKSIGAEADLDGLVPFTRWLTPVGVPKRFTTQMYLYLMPISRAGVPSEMLAPTPDGGVEHTEASFAPPQEFLSRAASDEMMLFPPQYYILSLLSRFLRGPTASVEEGPVYYTRQRRELLRFLKATPTADTDEGKEHATAKIAWADKVVSPHHLFVRKSDKRVVLGLEKPGFELRGSDRGGDWERVVLVNFGKAGPRQVEVRLREDVLKEERESASEGPRL